MDHEALEKLDHDSFACHVNSHFKVDMAEAHDGDTPDEVELVEANKLEDQETDGGVIEGFTLLFKGKLDEMLPQATHEFTHDKLGTFPMFISKVASTDLTAHYYEAVFQRIRK